MSFMSASKLFRLRLSFRFITALALTWLLYSAPGFAWRQINAPPYPAYPTAANPAPGYYPYPPPPRFYPGYAPAMNRYPGQYLRPPYPRYQPANFTRPPYPVAPAFQRQATPKPAPSINTPKRKPAVDNPTGSPDKQAFIQQLLPVIQQQNRRLLQQRQKLQQLFSRIDRQQSLSAKQQNWLKGMARRFRVKQNPLTSAKAREALLTKVDIIPPSLALAQAANESAWGTSRFASEANNLFGIWTYDASKGIAPKRRSSDKKHLVRKFDSYRDSIVYYMRMLNSHPAYQKLRALRRQARLQHQPIDGLTLASGLERYSARGEKYIESIRRLIRQNQWARLDPSALPG